MTTEIKRDLIADLAICDAATEGPWAYEDGGINILAICEDGFGCPVCGDFGPERIEDSRFITEAREGWAHAIRRAIVAEAESERLLRGIYQLRDRLMCDLDAITSGDTTDSTSAYEDCLETTLRRIDRYIPLEVLE